MALVLVKNFPNRMMAEEAQAMLEDEGIASVLQSPDMGILGAGAGSSLPQGVDLFVEDEEAEEAKAMLADMFGDV